MVQIGQKSMDPWRKCWQCVQQANKWEKKKSTTAQIIEEDLALVFAKEECEVVSL